MAALKKQIFSFFPSVKIVFGFDLFLFSLKFTELYLCYHAFEKKQFSLEQKFYLQLYIHVQFPSHKRSLYIDYVQATSYPIDEAFSLQLRRESKR